jgi:hypothetical protein
VSSSSAPKRARSVCETGPSPTRQSSASIRRSHATRPTTTIATTSSCAPARSDKRRVQIPRCTGQSVFLRCLSRVRAARLIEKIAQNSKLVSKLTAVQKSATLTTDRFLTAENQTRKAHLLGWQEWAQNESGRLPDSYPPIIQDYRVSSARSAIAQDALQIQSKRLESLKASGKTGFVAWTNSFFGTKSLRPNADALLCRTAIRH